MKKHRVVATALILSTLLGSGAAAAAAPDSGVTPQVAEQYLQVLRTLETANGAAKKTEFDLWTGLCFARLVDFDGDGRSELCVGYGAADSAMANMQSVFSARGSGAPSEIYHNTLSNFGTDVSPETLLYVGATRAYLVSGQAVMHGGTVSYLTKDNNAPLMSAALRYTAGEKMTLNDSPVSRDVLQTRLDAFTAGMTKLSFSYWEDSTAATVATTRAALSASKAASPKPMSATVLVDGRSITFGAYEIGGNNFFKLRDLAMALNGSKANFNVTWDASKNAMNLLSSTAYVSVGGELVPGAAASVQAKSSTAAVSLDGAATAFTAYEISNNNYFKLRDVAKALNFFVGWDNATSTITIDTTLPYSE